MSYEDHLNRHLEAKEAARQKQEAEQTERQRRRDESEAEAAKIVEEIIRPEMVKLAEVIKRTVGLDMPVINPDRSNGFPGIQLGKPHSAPLVEFLSYPESGDFVVKFNESSHYGKELGKHKISNLDRVAVEKLLQSFLRQAFPA